MCVKYIIKMFPDQKIATFGDLTISLYSAGQGANIYTLSL